MRILVLFAHPRLSESITHRAMLAAIKDLDRVKVHDLYAAYPHHDIDVEKEQALLDEHDLIIMQHPVYWYSSPAILKEWQDLVLERGWAYGRGGTKLQGKFMLQALSTGGRENQYSPKGHNRFRLDDFFKPFNQTAYLCGMAWLDPFVIYGSRSLSAPDLSAACEAYRHLVIGLREGTIAPMKRLAKGYVLPANFKPDTGRK